MTTQARMHGAAALWSMLVISLVFVAAGIGMLIFEPHKWLVALASTAFFVVCAVVAVRMIVLRRRAVGGRS